MRFRKRLTLSVITIAFILFLGGSIADLMTTTKEDAAQEIFQDANFLEPASKIYRNFTVNKPDSPLTVILSATDRLQMDIKTNNQTEYTKDVSQLYTTFLIREPGQWVVTFRNDLVDRVNYTYSITLTTFTTTIEHPLSWLFFPTFIAGEAALCLIIPITFHDNIRKKLNKRTAGILTFSVMVILAFGFMPLLTIITGTSTPLVSPITSSMKPTIWPGDLAVVTGINPKALNVGDILVYDKLVENLTDPVAETISYPTMHRIARIVVDDNSRFFVTKGDNNEYEDSWFVPEDGVKGKVVLIIPYVGNIVMLLSRIEIKIIIIAVAIGVLVMWPNKKKLKVKKNEEKTLIH